MGQLEIRENASCRRIQTKRFGVFAWIWRLQPADMAAECTSEDIAKYLVKHGADMNKKDGDGNTAYDIAKENQFFSDVDFLK